MNPFEPELSFEEKINELHRHLGRHPAYKDQWGRDPEDSDSENDLSDETMERLYQEDEKKRFEVFDRVQGKGKAVEKAGKVEKKEKGVVKEKKAEKKRRNDSPPPPCPLPVEAPPPKKRKRALSFSPEPAKMQVDHPPPPPPPSHAPIASPSGHNSNKKHSNPVSSPPPPQLDNPPSPEILELSSDDADDERPSTKNKERTSTKTKPSRSKKASPSKSTTVTTTTKGKSKAKPRQSMEQALEVARKIKPEQLKNHFVDISSFIDHLSSFEMDRPSKLLEGCRIAFVNADHWLANRGANGPRNRFDQGLTVEMGIVIKKGGTLIKPEEFVGSPQDATLQEIGSSEEIERRAEEEGWTTHIIGFSPAQQRSPNFTEILKCLGDKNGIKMKDLGPYVKVIKFNWVSQSILAGKRQSEWEFAIEPDPRNVTASSRSSSTKSSPTKKKKSSAKDRRQGRKKGPEEDGDTTGGSEGEDDEAVIRGISPFGTQDYPVGEKPPLVAHSDKGKGKATANLDDEDKNEPINATSNNPLEGLEAQSKLVKQLGDEEFDRELDEVEREPDSMIYTGVNDDCETENEEEEAEKEKEAKKKGSEYKASRWDEKRSDRAGYAVNRDFVPRGQNEGANDRTADVLERLSELHKGDQWRERGYRIAAGALRRHKAKVTTYEKLIQIRGIGDSIASKIVEIVQTGSHRKLENELPQERAARLLSGIYGIGLARGRELAIKGAKTPEDLKRPEYFAELTSDQQIGLKYYDDLLSRIPRAEVTKLYGVVLAAARRVDPKLQVECMGSYRRGQPDSGDIDILVTRDPSSDGKTHSGAIGKMSAILYEEGFFRHILSQSDDWSDLHCKVNGLCQLDEKSKVRRIDILGVPWDDMPAAMIYFTGNDHYNRSLRLKARHMGYSLNQKCLSKSVIRDKKGEKMTEGTRVPGIKTEQDIFRILKVPYKRPEERIPS